MRNWVLPGFVRVWDCLPHFEFVVVLTGMPEAAVRCGGNIDRDTDGTRTAPDGYLDSGKRPAYRGYRGRSGPPSRRCRGGYRARAQRVLPACASGQRVAKRVSDGFRHANAVGNFRNADTYSHHANPNTHHSDANAHTNSNHAHTDADTHADADTDADADAD